MTSGRNKLLAFCVVLAGCCSSGVALAGAQERQPEIVLRLTPLELKVIARAMAAHSEAETQPLVVKLQAQINTQFPPGPWATELPLPTIEGTSR